MDLIDRLSEITIEPAPRFSWVPSRAAVTYDPLRIDTAEGQAQFLHELSHALLGHPVPTTDLRARILEAEAWQTAELIGRHLGIEVGEEWIASKLS